MYILIAVLAVLLVLAAGFAFLLIGVRAAVSAGAATVLDGAATAPPEQVMDAKEKPARVA